MSPIPIQSLRCLTRPICRNYSRQPKGIRGSRRPTARTGHFGAGLGASGNEITDLGLRWQSLIISPNRQSWMTPPSIEDRQRYGWWERLRAVPSCWLSSQGESERFLYYDGPTRMSLAGPSGRQGKDCI